MKRKDRLIDIIAILRDGKLHRAKDLAFRTSVNVRSIYRDMETLLQSGVPVSGRPGVGYQMTTPVTLPAINLTMEELETLHLGIAVMTEATDPGLRAAAQSLAAKFDAALPEGQISRSTGWDLAVFPFADTAAGIAHMPTLRAAVRNRQKLEITYRDPEGDRVCDVVCPLQLEFWGRVWTCKMWCERQQEFAELRVDRIEQLVEITEYFSDNYSELANTTEASS